MWTFVNIFLMVLLAIAVTIGLTATTQKKSKNWLVISRLLYIVMLFIRAGLSIHFLANSPLSIIVKFALLILIIVLIEASFVRKQSQTISLQYLGTLFGTFILSVLFSIYI